MEVPPCWKNVNVCRGIREYLSFIKYFTSTTHANNPIEFLPKPSIILYLTKIEGSERFND